MNLAETTTLSPQQRLELVHLEEAMWRAETRFDREFQEHHFAADFLEFGRSGRVYRRSDALRTTKQAIAATLPLPNIEVRMIDTDTALVIYDSEVCYEGVVERAHRSSIWSRSAQGWVMRFHQGTPF